MLLAGVLVLAVGCSGPVEPPSFDGDRAYQYLEQQVAFGPRVPGTEAAAQCRNFFYRHFDSCGLAIDSQVFRFFDPYSKTDSPLVNVIARHRGDPSEERALLLLAHFDTRPRTDFHSDSTKRHLPIQGANDGASGVAILMEIANMIKTSSPNCNIDILLVDGEDWGKPGDIDYYLLGSREFARRGIRDDYIFGIVVDLVGDKYQEIYREEYTERYYKPINDMIWKTAKELGVTTFREGVRHTIQDDHLSIGAAGVPTALLIDFDYPHWHTENDTPDKCSAEALANVGRVLAYIIYNKQIWPND